MASPVARETNAKVDRLHLDGKDGVESRVILPDAEWHLMTRYFGLRDSHSGERQCTRHAREPSAWRPPARLQPPRGIIHDTFNAVCPHQTGGLTVGISANRA